MLYNEEIGEHVWRFLKYGDPESLEILYKQYHDNVLNYIVRFAASGGFRLVRDDAEEICDDVYITIWQKRDIFRLDPQPMDFMNITKDFIDWQFLISRWKTLDHIKHSKKLLDHASINTNGILKPIFKDNHHIDDHFNIETTLKLLSHLKEYEKYILFNHCVVEIPYNLLTYINSDREKSEKERSKEAANLRKIRQRACNRLKKSNILELTKIDLEEEAKRLKDACKITCRKLIHLMKKHPMYVNKKEGIRPYTRDLSVYIIELTSFIMLLRGHRNNEKT